MTEISRDKQRILRNKEYLHSIGSAAITNEKHERVPRLPKLKFLESEVKEKKRLDESQTEN